MSVITNYAEEIDKICNITHFLIDECDGLMKHKDNYQLVGHFHEVIKHLHRRANWLLEIIKDQNDAKKISLNI